MVCVALWKPFCCSQAWSTEKGSLLLHTHLHWTQRKKHGQRLAIAARKRSKNRDLWLKIRNKVRITCPRRCFGKGPKPCQETYLAIQFCRGVVCSVSTSQKPRDSQKQYATKSPVQCQVNRFACMPAFLHQAARWQRAGNVLQMLAWKVFLSLVP